MVCNIMSSFGGGTVSGSTGALCLARGETIMERDCVIILSHLSSWQAPFPFPPPVCLFLLHTDPRPRTTTVWWHTIPYNNKLKIYWNVASIFWESTVATLALISRITLLNARFPICIISTFLNILRCIFINRSTNYSTTNKNPDKSHIVINCVVYRSIFCMEFSLNQFAW